MRFEHSLARAINGILLSVISSLLQFALFVTILVQVAYV